MSEAVDHFKHIYRHRAAAYRRMIAAEDAGGNLLPALQRIVDFTGKCVLDVGTGTGRLPALLPHAAQVVGVDLHAAMLHENRIILETLGTGRLAPAPPAARLAAYYRWLETEWGFSRHEIRTDYRFAGVAAAAAATEFFFGPELAATIRAHGWARIPEWTGIWFAPAGETA